MSSTTPSAAPTLKKGRKPDKSEGMTESAPATSEELRSKILDTQIELQQERGKVRRRCTPSRGNVQAPRGPVSSMMMTTG